MFYLAVKAFISGILIAAASEVAKHFPGFGGLSASLPLVSVLGMIWLWRDKPDAENMAAHAGATFWYVIPSLPMFLLIPVLLRSGLPFWLALTLGWILTIVLYLAMTLLAPRFRLRL
ncbi:DUF3147 family protein [Sphingomonas glacialis]|uniref:DUF3147 family protein n=1 Tax=Sphingomonas glacialis TaxID=658225 RepID=A0A502FF21_9SPHN|nr:DUF3147 family protein [Sphingomonas glacialis]TPG48017.1 DUF3147 family protein [Sphingomonas glacialis]